MNCSRFAKAFLILAGICLLLFCFHSSFRSHPVQYYNVSVVSTNSSYNTWKAIIPNELFVYSAFYALPRDNDQVFSTIKVIAIVNRRDKAVRDAITCSCILGGEMVNAVLKDYPEHHGELYAAASITCPAPANISHMDFRCQLKSTVGSVGFDISPPPSRSSAPQPLSMAVCGPILFGSGVRAEHIVEFVEYYRMMGVSHYFFNVYYTSPFFGNVTEEVIRVLEYYESLGLMSVGNWTIPVEIERKVHYNGQLAALNECILQTTGFWDYVVVVDIDEFIISQHGTPLSSIIQKGSRDCTIIRHAAIKSSLSPTVPPGSLDLRLQRHLHRDARIWNANERSKYICRPRSILTAGIHFLHEARKGTRTLVGGNVEEMLLLHFSEGLIDEKTGLVEMDMDRWFGLARLAEYGEKVNGVYQSIFSAAPSAKS